MQKHVRTAESGVSGTFRFSAGAVPLVQGLEGGGHGKPDPNKEPDQGGKYVNPKDRGKVSAGEGELSPDNWKEDLRPDGHGHGRRGDNADNSGYYGDSPNQSEGLPGYYFPEEERWEDGGLVFVYRDWVKTNADVGDLVDIDYYFKGVIIDVCTGDTLDEHVVHVRLYGRIGGTKANPKFEPLDPPAGGK